MVRPLSFAWPVLVVGLAALVSGSNCPLTEEGGPDGGGGTTQQFCSETPDCPEFMECVNGVCQRPCGTDDVCDPTQYCTRAGYCLEGCRDSSMCAEEHLCADGVCRHRSEVGTCATKADCVTPPDTLVCRDGQCVSPPSSCAGPQDCPGPQQCNGFSHVCFDPAGECQQPSDCAGKPQCADGCTCTQDRRCVATPTCTLESEATVCGVGSYCDLLLSPARCAPVPVCQRQADCDATRLACNTGTRECQRSASCTSSTACAATAFLHCNTSAGYCQEPTCLNGGVTCVAPNDQCRTDGTCGAGSTIPCSANTQCPTSPMQYCDTAAGICKVGCRDNSNCTAPQTCNGLHQCAGGSSSSGGAGDGEPCPNGDGDCRAGYLCSGLGVCREQCQTGSCPPCPETGYGCFMQYCSPIVTPSC